MFSTLRAGSYGFLLGSAAGIALGVLIAPEEGRKMRRRAVFQIERLAVRLGNWVDDFTKQETLASEARRSSEAIVQDVEEQASRIRAEIDALIGGVRGR